MRNEKTKVKTTKGRRKSSVAWLQRQLNDPFVKKSKADGYRSRAVYKLEEIDKKTNLFRAGLNVIDLGAAPGGWTQYALRKNCRVVGIDLLDIEPIVGATLIKGDFLDDSVLPDLVGNYDIVMSDMAANSSGYPGVDHMRVMELVETAFFFCQRHLKVGGHFVAKILMGGQEQKFAQDIRKHFDKVRFVKPEASRTDSSETYIVCMGYKG